jgi:hypothetical protein
MSLSFQEKSLWAVLVSLLIAFGAYFCVVLPASSPNVAPGQIGLFVSLLVFLVVIQITGHTILAIGSRRELAKPLQRDERDTFIDLKSARIGSYVLAAGVFASLCVALLVPGNFAFIHTLLAGWMAAQAAEIVSQLVFYRRGG